MKAVLASRAASDVVPEDVVSCSMRRAARASRAAARPHTKAATAQTAPTAANQGWAKTSSRWDAAAPTSALSGPNANPKSGTPARYQRCLAQTLQLLDRRSA